MTTPGRIKFLSCIWKDIISLTKYIAMQMAAKGQMIMFSIRPSISPANRDGDMQIPRKNFLWLFAFQIETTSRKDL